MTENRHDLVLAAAEFCEQVSQALAHAVSRKMRQAGVDAPALEHGRHAVSAGEWFRSLGQNVDLALDLRRSRRSLQRRQERDGDFGRFGGAKSQITVVGAVVPTSVISRGGVASTSSNSTSGQMGAAIEVSWPYAASQAAGIELANTKKIAFMFNNFLSSERCWLAVHEGALKVACAITLCCRSL